MLCKEASVLKAAVMPVSHHDTSLLCNELTNVLIFLLLQIEDMKNEVKYSNYVESGEYTTDMDLGGFIKCKIHTCPVVINISPPPPLYYSKTCLQGHTDDQAPVILQHFL